MRFNRCARLLLGLGVSWLLSAQVTIQPRPKPPAKQDTLPGANIRVETNLVLVPVA